MSRYEYHDYFSHEGKTVLTTSFVFQVVNMGVLALVVGSRLVPATLFGFDMGHGVMTAEFNRFWYSSIATHLALLIVVQVILAQLFSMVTLFIVKPLRRLMKAKHAESQVKLNKLYQSPEFDVARRYSTLLSVSFVALSFSPAVPALVPLAALGLLLRYWFDKVALLRLLGKPSKDLVPLASLALAVVPWAAVCALAVGAWTFSAADVFSNVSVLGVSPQDQCEGASFCSSVVDDNGGNEGLGRLLPANVLPMVVVLVVAALGLTVGCPVRGSRCEQVRNRCWLPACAPAYRCHLLCAGSMWFRRRVRASVAAVARATLIRCCR